MPEDYYNKLKDEKFREKVLSINRPYQAVWNISYKCNLHCVFCSIPLLRPEMLIKELSNQKINSTMLELKELGVREIFFTGGEPLLVPTFLDILKETVKVGFSCEIVTNGTMITPDLAKELVGVGLKSITVSIESHNPRLHDSLTKKKGAFKKTINAIKLLSDEKRKQNSKTMIKTNTVLLSYNYRDILHLGNVLLSIGVDSVELQPFFPFIKEVEKFGISDKENVKKILNLFIKEIKRTNINDRDYFEKMCYILNSNQRHVKACFNPLMSMFISPSGKVYPCCFLSERKEYEMGDLSEQSIQEIWCSKKYESFRRKNLNSLQSPICLKCTTLVDLACKDFLYHSLRKGDKK